MAGVQTQGFPKLTLVRTLTRPHAGGNTGNRRRDSHVWRIDTDPARCADRVRQWPNNVAAPRRDGGPRLGCTCAGVLSTVDVHVG